MYFSRFCIYAAGVNADIFADASPQIITHSHTRTHTRAYFMHTRTENSPDVALFIFILGFFAYIYTLDLCVCVCVEKKSLEVGADWPSNTHTHTFTYIRVYAVLNLGGHSTSAQYFLIKTEVLFNLFVCVFYESVATVFNVYVENVPLKWVTV